MEGKDDHSVAAATQWLLLIGSLVDNIQQVSSSWLKDRGCACRCNGNAGKATRSKHTITYYRDNSPEMANDHFCDVVQMSCW